MSITGFLWLERNVVEHSTLLSGYDGTEIKVFVRHDVVALNCHWDVLIQEHSFLQNSCTKRHSSASFFSQNIIIIIVIIMIKMYWLEWRSHKTVLFCSLAFLDLRVGHTMDLLFPFISVLCHSDWLFHWESCLRIDVVHPGCVWSSSPACI